VPLVSSAFKVRSAFSGPDEFFAIGTVEMNRRGRILSLMNFRMLLALAVISTPALAQKSDTTAVKAEVMAADRALAASAAKNAAVYLSALTRDAAVLFPGQPILRGPDQARTAFMARYGGASSYQWTPAHAVASTDGRLACTMGYSRFTNALDSVKTPHSGTYLTCWKKDDGKWRVAGTQRADSPPKGSPYADSAILPGAPHSATTSQGKNPLRAAQDADSLFAMMGGEAAGPGPAFVKYVAEDGMLVGGDAFPRGPQQIGAAFEGYSPDRVIWWRPWRNVGAGSGGLAFTVGHATSGPRPGKTAGPTIGQKYFTVWRQEPDGRWLYIFDLGTSRPN